MTAIEMDHNCLLCYYLFFLNWYYRNSLPSHLKVSCYFVAVLTSVWCLVKYFWMDCHTLMTCSGLYSNDVDHRHCQGCEWKWWSFTQSCSCSLIGSYTMIYLILGFFNHPCRMWGSLTSMNVCRGFTWSTYRLCVNHHCFRKCTPHLTF